MTLVFLVTTVTTVGRFGAFGVVAGMGAGFLVMLILLQLMSWRFMPVSYPWAQHGFMWSIAILVVAFTYQLDVDLKGLVAKFAATIGVFSLPFWFGAIRISDIRLARDGMLSILR